jgi:hypothetical protein
MLLFIINGAGLIFPWESNFWEWTKTVKDLHFGDCSKKYFPCFEKEKRFSENKKKNIQQSRYFKILNYSQLLDNNLKFHIPLYMYLKYKGVKEMKKNKISGLSKSSKGNFNKYEQNEQIFLYLAHLYFH